MLPLIFLLIHYYHYYNNVIVITLLLALIICMLQRSLAQFLGVLFVRSVILRFLMLKEEN